MPKIVVRDNIYIPVKYINEDHVLDQYTTHLFDDQVCRGCEFKKHRPCDECGTCEFGGYSGSYCTASVQERKGKTYMRIPIGDRADFAEKVGINPAKFTIEDRRTKAKFRTKPKFLGDLRDYQVPVIKAMKKLGYGILKSAPRTGKTVMGIAGGIKLKQRIVIIADQKDFLDGFLETIMGSESAPALTNFPELEELEGRKLVGFPKTKEDYENFEIALVTYQSLLGKHGKNRIKWINRNYGTYLVDEVHAANADCYVKVLSKLKQRYKFGLTATPERKDKKHFLVEAFVGPVTVSTSVKALTPAVEVYPMPFVKSKSAYNGPAGFTYCETFLSKDKNRNAFLLQHVIADLKAGRSIAIGMKRVQQIHDFVKSINEAYGKDIAEAFVGGAKEKDKRKQIVDRARSSKTRVVVGSRKLMQRGINVPRWDTLYYCMPMSNKPNWEQESNRICTPASPDVPKKDPIIKMFVDPEISMSLGCFRKTMGFSVELDHEITQQAKTEIDKINRTYGRGRQHSAYDQYDSHLIEHEPQARKGGLFDPT